MSVVLGIDPGTTHSAYCIFDGEKPTEFGKIENDELLGKIMDLFGIPIIAIEMIGGYGQRVGSEVFETCRWEGRFEHIALGAAATVARVSRKDVKLHLCDTSRANDADVRSALIERFGPPGTKAEPGVTYGIKADTWAAFAVAVYAYDRAKKDGLL